jgi:protein O-mannosyl-transferase
MQLHPYHERASASRIPSIAQISSWQHCGTPQSLVSLPASRYPLRERLRSAIPRPRTLRLLGNAGTRKYMDRDQPAGPATAPPFLRPGTMEILACAVTALVYSGTLGFGFVYDDVLQIFKSPALREWRYLPQYFTSHVLAALYPGAGGNYYRPLLLLWLRLNYVMFGPQPAGWHATTVLCHVLATYLVFRVVQQVAGDRIIAFSAAILFGVHPVHIESVAWISGVSDPLMSCFFLGSLSAFFDWQKSDWRKSRKLAPAVCSLVLFGFALLSKETAVVLPGLIFVAMLVDTKAAEEGKTATRRVWLAMRESARYVLVAIVYLAVRFRALHGFSHPAISLSWTQVLLTWPAVLWFYARHLLLPVGLSEFYPLNYLDHATSRGFWLPLAMLTFLLLASWCWIRTLPQRSAVWFAVALIILPMLPVLDLRSLTVGDIVHDRYLYLPSAGFALLVALSIAALAQRMPERQRIVVPAAVIGVLSLLFAVLTVTEQMQWANDISLYTRGIESAPDNLTVRDNLANALMAANQPNRAIPLYLQVLKRDPNFWRSNYNLGFAYYETGNPAAAEPFFQRAIVIDGSDSDQYIYLALVDLQLKKLPDAADRARQAIARNPQARGYYFVLGLICESQGDLPAAIAAFKTELTLHPDNAAATAELQRLAGTATSPRP